MGTGEQNEAISLVLCQLAERYGRAICREPQRLEAMLRDLFPGARRETFLLVAAVKEQVVGDLLHSVNALPDSVRVAQGARKLTDNLGLAEEPARWAVAAWLPASQILASSPDRLVPFTSSDGAEEGSTGDYALTYGLVDWPWIGLCGLSVASSLVAIGTVGGVSLFHAWSSFGGWLAQTCILLAGLGLASLGMHWTVRTMKDRRAPSHRALPRAAATWVMLAEVVTILTLPLVPLLAVTVWAGEWAGAIHYQGQTHDLSFQLGRTLQSLPLAFFLYRWVGWMVELHGRIATALVRR